MNKITKWPIGFESTLSTTLLVLMAFSSISALGEWTQATLFDYPVGQYDLKGWNRSQVFNNRYEGHGYHLGDDWGMGDGKAQGQTVKAIGDGIVLKAGNAGACWADTVLILHTAPEDATYSLPNGDKSDYVVSFYGHLSDLRVKRNQLVKKGDAIGEVAPKTTCSTAAHLHLEIRKDIYPKMDGNVEGPGYFKDRPVTDSDSWINPAAFIDRNRHIYPSITPYGFGEIKFGMTTLQAVDKGLYPGDGVRFDSVDCNYGQLTTHPSLGFMFEGARVVRVDTSSPLYATAEGIRIGDTEEKVKAIYGGRLVIQGHQYDERGHYMIVNTPEKQHAVVMETDGSKVTQIRGGLAPAVFYVEGCH